MFISPCFLQLSDGAEVIKINKRFFLHNAGNNTMLKVDTMVHFRLIFELHIYGKYFH